MKKVGFLLLFIAIVVTYINADSPVKQQDTMELKTVEGKNLHLKITDRGFTFDDFKGKTVLLDFFGPACPPCIMEIPHLVEMQKKYEKEFQIVGIQVQMPMKNEDLIDFIKEKKINYPVVNLDDAWPMINFIRSNTDWGGQIPFMMMFDQNGTLKQSYLGLTSTETFVEDMKK
ncbi:MAG: hypothetical protein B6D59_05045 [Campylobacteraceae bacterium 4484_4]|nr:MAG: hypothetical protein B6D59_05045 [Campylobacteraceae bacterium 4484_4]